MKRQSLSLRSSFRAKVAAVALVTTFAALLVAFTLLLVQGWNAERRTLVLARGAAAEVLAHNLSTSLVFDDREGANIRLESVRKTSGFQSASVFDKDGRLFAQIGEGAKHVRPAGPAMSPTWRYTAETLEYRTPVIVDKERLGELVLVSDLAELWTMLRNYLMVAGLSFVLATGVALATGFWLARIIIEPVSTLAQAMGRVRSSGSFEHEVASTSDDEVGHLTNAFNDLLGELKRNDESLREAFAALTASQGAIKNLLDNADQGFLTVAQDLTVGDQSSAACETILGEPPAGKSIIDLLFGRTPSDAAASMRSILESVFRDSSEFARELKLSLLPVEFSLDGKFVRAGYKFLADSGGLMLILTDVTQTRLLTLQVEQERKRLEMIVLAVSESEAFAALTSDYQHFLEEELPQLILRFDDPAAPVELYRRLHTFKGLLAQFSFPFSPACLHEAETELAARKKWTVRAARKAFGSEALLTGFKRDLGSLTDALGSDFAPSGRRLALSQSQLESMEKVARAVLAGDEGRSASPPLRLLLQTLAGMGMLDVKAALSLHSRGALSLAERLEKQLAPINVQGDNVTLAPERYSEFFRSLVHLLRNAVDHGIEHPDERLLAGKPADGTITCNVGDHGAWIEIEIADDGRGVDRGALEDRLVASGETRGAVEALSLEDLVFREGLSSRDAANDVSGRGVGLAAVRAELDRLGGSVSLTTERGLGSRFRFRLPTGRDAPSRDVVAVQRIAQ